MNRRLCLAVRSIVATVLVASSATVISAPSHVAAAPTATGTIVVRLFHDFNANGRRDVVGDLANPAIDRSVAGATVQAVCLTDTGPDGQAGSGDAESYGAPIVATGDGAGTYTIAADGTPCRIEVSDLPANYAAAPIGSANRGLTSFADVGATVDVGVHIPGEFCQNDPALVTGCFVAGAAPATTKNARGVEVLVPPQTAGSPTALHPTAPIGNITTVGSIYGLAWEPTSRRVFGAAYLKRKAELGPSGIGAIYTMNPAGPATNASLLVDLAALFPSSTGTEPRPAVKPDGYWDNDAEAVSFVGKRGLGDIEVSADGSRLFVVGLNDRRLYSVPLSGAITASTITAHQIPTMMTSCADADLVRPFGLGVDPKTGILHVGGVCPSATPRVYVWAFDGTAFTAVVDQALVRSDPDPDTRWLAWNDTDLASTRAWNPQPMVSDISFRGDDLVIGIRDRFGDMAPGDGLGVDHAPYPRGGGDILRACLNGAGTYVLEHPTASYCGTTGEYFFQDEAGDAADESGAGAVVQIGGWRGLYDTAYGAVAFTAAGVPIDDNWYRGGVQYHAHDSRTQIGSGDIYAWSLDLFGKSNGMADLVALCDRAPIEIGNRVWFDTNNNGLQDPGELPAANIPVTLTVDGVSYDDVTNARGEYVFSSDTRATGDRASIENGQYGVVELVPGATVTLSVPTVKLLDGVSWSLTGQNNGDDRFDSDANVVTGATAPIVVGSPGFNDHDWDFGYASSYDLALSKTVSSTGDYTIGSTVTFDLTATNNGPGGAASGFTVTDLLPVGLTFSGVQSPAEGIGFTCAAPTGQSVTCTSDAGLASNATAAPIRITAIVAAGATSATELRNVAWIAPSVDDGAETIPLGTPPTTGTDTNTSPTNNDSSAAITINTAINLRLAKQLVTPAPYRLGQTVTYRLSVSNDGPATALQSFAVTDTLPVGLTFAGVNVPAAGVGYACAAPVGRSVTCTSDHTLVPTVAPVVADAILITATIAATAPVGTTLRNVAWVSPAPSDPNVETNPLVVPTSATDTAATSTDNDASAVLSVGADYDLALVKTTPAGQRAMLWGHVTYTVTVANQGNVASGAFTVTDRLPAGTMFASATPNATHANGVVTWMVPAASQLAPGATRSFSVTVKITGDAKVYRNWAEISADSGNDTDSVPDTNTGRDTTPPNDAVVNHNDITRDTVAGDEDDNDFEEFVSATQYDLALVKRAAAGQRVAPGTTVAFTITVKNQGNVASGAFVVQDRLPAGTAFVSADGAATHAGGLVTWRIATLAVGASQTFTVRVLITSEALRYINRAEITSDSGNDEDSTPDADIGQDGTAPNDAVINHNDITRDTVVGDEDDNDLEQLMPSAGIHVPETL